MEQTEQRWESYQAEDADVVLVAYGISSRISKEAVNMARAEGFKLGLIRPITLWPFPKNTLLAAADHVKHFISVELSMGQMIEDVELAIRCKRPVDLCVRTGGMIPTPEQVLATIKKMKEENN